MRVPWVQIPLHLPTNIKMRKYLLLLPLVALIACGDSNSTKYCADGSLAPCNDGSVATSPTNNAIAPGYVPPVQQEQRSQQSSSSSDSGGISWGSAILGYAVGSMLGNSFSPRNETIQERIIERPAATVPSTSSSTQSKSFNGQESRNSAVKPPAAKPATPPAAKPSSSSPKSSGSSFGGSSSRSSGGRR